MISVSLTKRGFTLIELLVVIAIIGLLSSIVLGSLNAARTKAQASRILQDFQTIQTAFMTKAITEGQSTWWIPSGNPTISSLVQGGVPNLGPYLSSVPTSPISSADYYYDNDGDVSNCASVYNHGVNLYIYPVSSNLMTELDKMVDHGDGATCGKVTYNASDSSLVYHLSDDQQIR